MQKQISIFLILLLLSTSSILASNVNRLTSIKSSVATNSVFEYNDTLFVDLDLNSLLDKDIVNKKNKLLIDISHTKQITISLNKIINNKDKNNFSWIGENKKQNIFAILSVREGVLSGNINIKKDTYKILHVKNSYKITKENKSNLLPLKNDVVYKNSQTLFDKNSLYDTVSLLDKSAKTKISVLLFYTKSLKDKYGTSTTSNIQNMFDYAITAYEQSQTNVELELAGIEMLPYNSELNNIIDINRAALEMVSSDGYVFFKKSQYNADMVSLIVPQSIGDTCGIGWSSTSIVNYISYSIAGYRPNFCSIKALAHEMGHNFGCDHDEDHTDKATYPYGYGYYMPNQFATIMSYYQPEIPYFSNPNLTHNGYTIGDSSSADNARVIRENRFKMAMISDDISMDLESSDSIDDYDIKGTMYKNGDMDAYRNVKLGGETTILGENEGYIQWYFYVDIYDSNHNLVISDNGGSDNQFTHSFENGEYTLVVRSGLWENEGDKYNLTISTNYVEEPNNSKINPSVIMYLLN